MKSILTLLLISSLATVGCASYQEHAAKRTARLREVYPPGTPKAEVQSRWGQMKPDFSATRPDQGWDACANRFIAKKLQNEEASTGKSIASVDRYWGPDGLWSLCYCWFYYDSADKIVDVEWQYKSD
jgi:hypothetical protein